jgi:hypothetical protein
MALQIQLSTDFTPSAVNFSKMRKNKMGGKAVYLSGAGNNKLYIQLPFMKAPYGLSSYTDEATKKTSYSLDLSLDPNDPVSAELQSKLEEFDQTVLKTVEANCEEWLGKKYGMAVMKEALYKPLVRPGKGEWPATIKLKILVDNKTGNFIPEAYNTRRDQVSLDSLEKGQKVMAIVDLNQIWFIDNKFGVTVRLQQCLLEPSKKLPSFAFQGVCEPGENEFEEEVEYEEVEEEVDAN